MGHAFFTAEMPWLAQQDRTAQAAGGYLLPLLETIESLGLATRAELLAAAGCSEADLYDEHFRFPLSRYASLALWLYLSAPMAGTGLLFGDRLGLRSHGLLASAVSTASNGEEALQLFLRYFSHRFQFVAVRQWHLESGDLRVEYRSTLFLGQLQAFFFEFSSCALRNVLLGLFGREALQGMIYEFAHARPEYHDHYQHMLGEPPHFDQPCTAMIIPAALLQAPITTSNPPAHQELLKLLQQRYDVVDPDNGLSLTERIRLVLARPVDRMPDLDAVAQDLHLSPRTLRYRLNQEHICFRDLVEAERMRRAEQLLRDTSLPLGMVADKAGYTEHSNFTRAFRRVNGETPLAYRSRCQHLLPA